MTELRAVVSGLAVPCVVYAIVIALQLVLPARSVTGYARDGEGKPLRYRLNGLFVAVVVIGLWANACKHEWIAWDLLWTDRFASLAGACTLGLVFTGVIVLTAPPTGAGLAKDLFLGRLWNPQRGRLDAKMSLYLLGAVMLALNVLSFAAHHVIAYRGDISPGVCVYAAMFLFFLGEYLTFERVHLYTYDLFAERVGFKLGWGCLTFYPYFYCIGLWSEADRPDPHAPLALTIASVIVFLCGWSLARGANLQKFRFKLDPTASFLGIAPVAVRDDHHALLCSGFWRVSRHVNYLGEILMAVGLTLALGRPLDPIPWLYPIYYLALLIPRERDDDRRCAAKYGALWDTYKQRVRWRIIPRVY